MRLRQVVLGISVSVLATVTLVAVGPSPQAGANPTPGIKPDITLSPGGDPQYIEYKSTLVGMNRNETPDSCRTHPVFNHTCDALRLKLNLDPTPGADNFVILELSWAHVQLPNAAVVVTAVKGGVTPDLDLVVYKTPTSSLSSLMSGGQINDSPERVAFPATQSEYDLVIKCDTGMVQSYGIRAYMADTAGAPFELLDDVFERTEDTTAPSEFQEDFVPPAESIDFGSAVSELAPLPAATVLPDRQFAGTGFRITENFGNSTIDFGRSRTRDVVAVGKPPSGITLVVALLLVPVALAAAGTLWLRRRRQALI